MALEDFVSVAVVLLSFVPLYIGMALHKKEGVFEQIVSWFLYWVSLLMITVDTHFLRKVLERAFGALPTTVEGQILGSTDIVYNIEVTVLIVFGAIVLLATIIQAFLSIRAWKTKPDEEED